MGHLFAVGLSLGLGLSAFARPSEVKVTKADVNDAAFRKGEPAWRDRSHELTPSEMKASSQIAFLADEACAAGQPPPKFSREWFEQSFRVKSGPKPEGPAELESYRL